MQRATLFVDGTYPFVLTRRTRPEYEHQYGARLVVEGCVARIELSRGRAFIPWVSMVGTASDARPVRVFVQKPKVKDDVRVFLALEETEDGVSVRGKIGGFVVDASPRDFIGQNAVSQPNAAVQDRALLC